MKNNPDRPPGGGRKTILSGATTTGDLTLGNYIGAIRNWRELQRECDCFYFLADLHALTSAQRPEEFRERVFSFFAQYLALGLDPRENTLFVQSHVREHAEMAWILTCLTPLGHLNRMTQFKDKSLKSPKNLNAGLLTYPVLMAADILLYDADLVPVGEDQRQHLELCRNLVDFFHNRYGAGVLAMPEAMVPKTGARVMGLQRPLEKMSKSDGGKNVVSILDPPERIRKKIRSAVTDSEDGFAYEPKTRPGLANLLGIHAALSGKGPRGPVRGVRGGGLWPLQGRLGRAGGGDFRPCA